MPVRADFAVVLDACVLAEAAVSDLFLRLSEEPRLLLPKWTERIWDETTRTCVDKLGWRPDLAERRRSLATAFFPEALVEGYEHLEAECVNDEGDRHVLAAAIHEHVETIVTSNLRHFPQEALEPWGIVAVHPGSYLVTLYEHDAAVVFDKIRRIALDRNKSVEELLGRLAWAVPTFTHHVAIALDLDIPKVTPQDWLRSRP
jgi:hypothetical protein